MATRERLFELTGKVALITGGSRGLGREMALAFAALGADLMIVSGDLNSCQTVGGEVRKSTGREAVPYACHVGNWAALDQLEDVADEEFGQIDILVNNAGMSPLYPSANAITEEIWDKVFDVNLKGPFRLSALVGPRMIANGGGCIMNVSSGVAVRPRPDVIPYSAAKAGLGATTVALASEFGPTVRVNALRPEPFLTDISKAWDMDAFDARAGFDFALQRGGQPQKSLVRLSTWLAMHQAIQRVRSSPSTVADSEEHVSGWVPVWSAELRAWRAERRSSSVQPRRSTPLDLTTVWFFATSWASPVRMMRSVAPASMPPYLDR